VERNFVWLACNDQYVWPMQHEGDYSDGDTLIHVEVQEGGKLHITIDKVKEQPDPAPVLRATILGPRPAGAPHRDTGPVGPDGKPA